MAKRTNQKWNLEAFLDSFILELDKARDTLAVKGMNQPLTYTVRDVSLDLHIFPEYDGRRIKFTTAMPGDEGASKVSIQLGSITDRQIRQTTKEPVKDDDISLDDVEDIDEEEKDALRSIGVTSFKDLEKLEQRNVKLDKIPKVREKMKNFSSLADRLKQVRSGRTSRSMSEIPEVPVVPAPERGQPTVKHVALNRDDEGTGLILQLEGDHLALANDFQPQARLNRKDLELLLASPQQLQFRLEPSQLSEASNTLEVALDPSMIFKLNLK